MASYSNMKPTRCDNDLYKSSSNAGSMNVKYSIQFGLIKIDSVPLTSVCHRDTGIDSQNNPFHHFPASNGSFNRRKRKSLMLSL